VDKFVKKAILPQLLWISFPRLYSFSEFTQVFHIFWG